MTPAESTGVTSETLGGGLAQQSKELISTQGGLHDSPVGTWEWLLFQRGPSAPTGPAFCRARHMFVSSSSWVPFGVPLDCDSWFCWSCADVKAGRVLLDAIRLFEKWGRVWFTAVPIDTVPFSRLRRRHKRKGGELFWVRRTDGELHIFASADLSGPRKAPAEGQWLDVDQATAVLRYSTLRLPGPVDLHATNDAVSASKRRRRSKRETVRVGPYSRTRAQEIQETAVERLVARTGRGPEHLSREEITTGWADLLREVTAELLSRDSQGTPTYPLGVA